MRVFIEHKVDVLLLALAAAGLFIVIALRWTGDIRAWTVSPCDQAPVVGSDVDGGALQAGESELSTSAQRNAFVVPGLRGRACAP